MPVDNNALPAHIARNDQAEEVNTPLGVRLRHARLARGLRLKDVAEKVPCSESLISKIERNRAVPSLRMLHRLAAVLDTSIAVLLTPTAVGDEIVSRKGDRPILQLDSTNSNAHILLERLIPYQTGLLLEANIHIVEPGAESDGEIQHKGEEIGYILEGCLQLWVDGVDYNLFPGDVFYFDSSRRHRYRNVAATVTRILWVNTPPTF